MGLIITLLGLVALPICAFAFPIGRKLGVLDRPDRKGGRKRHAKITPLVGGIATATPVILALVVLGILSDALALLVLAGVVAATLFLGFVDDRQHLRPSVRLVIASLIILPTLYFVPDFAVHQLISSRDGSTLTVGSFALPFTLVCLLGLQNAVNMADGKNGLVIGLSVVWTGIIASYAPTDLLPVFGALGLALGIAFFFNWRGKLFLGDAGSYSISALMGLLAIYVYNVSATPPSAEAVVLWFMVPVADCLRLIVSRALKGRSPFSPDRNHLHHYIYDAMPWRVGLPFYLCLVAMPAALANLWAKYTIVWIMLAGIAYVFLYITATRAAAEAQAEMTPAE